MARRQHQFAAIIIPLLLLGLTFSCNAFSGSGFGVGKPINNHIWKRQGEIQGKIRTQLSSSSDAAEKQTINLGVNKSVQIWVPPNGLEDDSDEITKFTSAAAASNLLEDYANYRGTGDVIWPSSLHLSRLVANCPSFVEDRRVLDLGCGLGLASLATLLSNPKSLTLSDVDENVLDWAMKSCEEYTANSNDVHIERIPIDWTDMTTWPKEKGSHDVVLASDILYDAKAGEDVAKLLSHVLLLDDDVNARALIVDPMNRPNRDDFVLQLTNSGFDVGIVPFPGQEDSFVLINATPKD